MAAAPQRASGLHRNVWVASATSFLTDVSSEMLQNVLPLFLANVLGVRTWAVGLVEGVAEATASVLKLGSGWLSDRLRARKHLAVAGYALSAVSKPFYLLATSWPVVALVRWSDRVGKGVRTAPRDALLADSVAPGRRGLAFGLHRAADTGGAVFGLLAALAIVTYDQGGGLRLEAATFRTLVAWSVAPAILAVLVLAVGAQDVPVGARQPSRRPSLTLKGLGRDFGIFLAVSTAFQLGNSSDAFLILRAQERGLGVLGLLWMLVGFNLVYTAVAAPAGRLADRFPRKRVLAAAWVVYALVYLGFAMAESRVQVIALFVVYGMYHGMAAGAAKALVADLVAPELRGTAFGTYHAAIGLAALPASLIAGLLWQGIGPWPGLGPSAPFLFGAMMAGLACAGLALYLPANRPGQNSIE